ncbi:MAG: ribosome biogenesis GTPase Der [Bacteroidales bacterium]|nr:ribosome biogenesis GTPase Der [Bacteroidales bacterium]
MAIVAIVGRPNVGKSTLFNRLVGRRQAIVDETEGVTRDRHYGKSDWNGRDFSVIDTGGYVINSDDIFEEEIRKQVDLAISEADIITFVVDVENGITDMDMAVANILHRQKKPVMLVVNKVDNGDRLVAATEFYGLGLGEYFCISSINGSGTGELLDEIVKLLPAAKPEEKDELEGLPRFAVIGRPNAGKSSFINSLIGEERNIVTNIAGTTRDSIHTHYNKFNHNFVIVDTAGIRKKSKVHEDLEFYSVMRAVKSIEDSDVCIVMMDATRGIEAQDLAIYNLAIKNKRGVVLVVNKWDLIEKETNTMKQYQEDIERRIAPFNDIPIVFTSVTEKQRISKVLDAAMDVYENRIRKISTSTLNEVMLKAIEKYPPPAIKGKFIKIKYVTQIPTHAPAFAFFCNLPQYVKEPYKRYLENKIREAFDFKGVPISIFIRKK